MECDWQSTKSEKETVSMLSVSLASLAIKHTALRMAVVKYLAARKLAVDSMLSGDIAAIFSATGVAEAECRALEETFLKGL